MAILDKVLETFAGNATKKANVSEMAVTLASQFTLDATQIKDTYKNRPDSLRAHFEATNSSWRARAFYLAATVAAVPLFVLPAILPGYFAYRENKNLKTIKAAIEGDMKAQNNVPR